MGLGAGAGNFADARAWRVRVGGIAKALEVAGMAAIRRLLGTRWADHWREAITLPNDEEWKFVLSLLSERTIHFGYHSESHPQ